MTTARRPAVALLLSLSHVPLLAQSGGAFVERTSAWPLSVAPPQAPPLTPVSTGRAVAGLLDDDALPDVATVTEAGLAVLLDPATWTQSVTFGGSGVVDVALFERGAEAADALVSVGTAGLEIWRWKPGVGFVSDVVAGSWVAPSRVVAMRSTNPAGYSVVVVLDAADDRVELVIVDEHGTEEEVELGADVLSAGAVRLDSAGTSDLLVARAQCVGAVAYAADCPVTGVPLAPPRPTTTFAASATCNEAILPPEGCTSVASGPAVAADLDGDGRPEVVLFDGGTGAARLFAQPPQPAMGFDLADGDVATGIELATVPAAGLGGAEDVRVLAWAWPDASVPELDTVPLCDVAIETDGGDATLEKVYFTHPAAVPEAVAIEVRGRASGGLTAAATFVLVDDCAVFQDLTTSLDLPVIREPDSCDPPTQVDTVGGIARLPRIPPRSSANTGPPGL